MNIKDSTGFMTFEQLAHVLFGVKDVTTADVDYISKLLASLKCKGMMDFDIVPNEEDHTQSLILFHVDRDIARAYYEGKLAFHILSSVVN